MFKKILISLAVFIGMSIPASAQVIHGHPEKAAYASSSEWPTRSIQCHWRNPQMMTGMFQHIHFDITAPYDAELTGPLVVPFALKLFHTDGAVTGIDLEGVRDLVWDDTGTTTPPPLVGDPMALKTWTGHLTLDPTLTASRWFTPHGWWAALVSPIETFTNGDSLREEVYADFYVILDSTAPESGAAATYYSGDCQPHSAAHPDIIWGNNFLNTYQPLPISPINTPWTNFINTAGYGAQGLPPAVFQQRVDLDLHNGIPGTFLKTITQEGDINTTVVFDPTVIGSGSHKMAMFRNQASLDGTEEVNSLMVLDVVVGTVNTGPPVDCVVGQWLTVSTSTTTSPAVTAGLFQTRVITTGVTQERPILVPPANGGAACPLQ